VVTEASWQCASVQHDHLLGLVTQMLMQFWRQAIKHQLIAQLYNVKILHDHQSLMCHGNCYWSAVQILNLKTIKNMDFDKLMIISHDFSVFNKSLCVRGELINGRDEQNVLCCGLTTTWFTLIYKITFHCTSHTRFACNTLLINSRKLKWKQIKVILTSRLNENLNENCTSHTRLGIHCW